MSLCKLRQFSISSALDDGRELPASLRRHIDSCPRCERFLFQARAVGEMLASAPGAGQAPDRMHPELMSRVRASIAGARARRPAAGASWWPAAAGLAAVAVLAGLIAITVQRDEEPEAGAASVPISTPVTPVHPASVPERFEKHAQQALSTEYHNLAADISGARKFLSASLRNTIPGLGGE